MTLSGQRTPQRHKKDVLREAILDAARYTMRREGFEAVSMRKIADAIGYSPASLYLHFSSRDAIAEALCIEGHRQLIEALHASASGAADPLRAASLAYLDFARAHEPVYRLIFMQSPAYTHSAMSRADETVMSILTKLLGEPGDPVTGASLWATLHGISSLSLNAADSLPAPAETLVEWALTPYLRLGAIGKTARRRVPDERA